MGRPGLRFAETKSERLLLAGIRTTRLSAWWSTWRTNRHARLFPISGGAHGSSHPLHTHRPAFPDEGETSRSGARSRQPCPPVGSQGLYLVTVTSPEACSARFRRLNRLDHRQRSVGVNNTGVTRRADTRSAPGTRHESAAAVSGLAPADYPEHLGFFFVPERRITGTAGSGSARAHPLARLLSGLSFPAGAGGGSDGMAFSRACHSAVGSRRRSRIQKPAVFRVHEHKSGHRGTSPR